MLVLEIGFFTQVICWVGLTYEEESELSAVHNLASHDVQQELAQDQMHKLRMSWTRLGKFDFERSNSPAVKRLKLQCLKTIGISDLKSGNAAYKLWKLACSPDDFFDELIKMCNMHQDGQIKDQVLNKVAGKGKKSKGEVRPVDFARTYQNTQQGTPIPSTILQDLCWIKDPVDFTHIVDSLKNVTQGAWSLTQFTAFVSKYKSIKFLRTQIKVQLGFSSWSKLLKVYGSECFSTQKLLTLLEELGKLHLSASSDEREQGWFQGTGKEKTVNVNLENFLNQVKNSKRFKEKGVTEVDTLPNHKCITLGPSDDVTKVKLRCCQGRRTT